MKKLMILLMVLLPIVAMGQVRPDRVRPTRPERVKQEQRARMEPMQFKSGDVLDSLRWVEREQQKELRKIAEANKPKPTEKEIVAKQQIRKDAQKKEIAAIETRIKDNNKKIKELKK